MHVVDSQGKELKPCAEVESFRGTGRVTFHGFGWTTPYARLHRDGGAHSVTFWLHPTDDPDTFKAPDLTLIEEE